MQQGRHIGEGASAGAELNILNIIKEVVYADMSDEDTLIKALKRLESDLDSFDIDSIIEGIPTADEVIAEAVKLADKMADERENQSRS